MYIRYCHETLKRAGSVPYKKGQCCTMQKGPVLHHAKRARGGSHRKSLMRYVKRACHVSTLPCLAVLEIELELFYFSPSDPFMLYFYTKCEIFVRDKNCNTTLKMETKKCNTTLLNVWMN